MVFRFKKFEVIQQHSAMKVGTDGVLLGAWADFPNPSSILDIGAGTGLISLMLAQRFKDAKIKAIEFDIKASSEAKQNFVNSEWNDRLEIINTDFFKWGETLKFDMLVCNPPYFVNDLPSPDKQRAMARSGTQAKKTFLGKAKEFMHLNSQVSFIIPTKQLTGYLQEAESIGLDPIKTLFVKPIGSKPPGRVLISFALRGKNGIKSTEDTLIIEEGGRHCYSKEYKKLTKDFYLKF